MQQPRILLVGYYGKGNFGDDVLLAVTHSILRHALPAARITVLAGDQGGEYIHTMLGDVDLARPGTRGHFDLIVHGGGGVFFDFESYGFPYLLNERLSYALGFPFFLWVEKTARALLNKPALSADRRIGIGIGVGTFSPGSLRLREKLPMLADMDSLWVRDPQSIENLSRFTPIMKTDVIEGSDLAFLTEHWIPSFTLKRSPSPRPRLGIVLRDWPHAKGGSDPAALKACLDSLASSYDITGFMFDMLHDPETRALLAPYPTHVWHPETMRFSDFMQLLGTQDVLLSSRAHGAICGACAGVPSVIAGIEPKLQQVHAMLPDCTRMVDPQQPESWQQAISAMLAVPRDAIASNLRHNHTASEKALHRIYPRFMP